MECPQCGCDLDVILNDHTYEHRLECANDDCDFVYSVARLWNDKTRSESLVAWLRKRVAELEAEYEDFDATCTKLRERITELELLEDAAIEFAKTMDIAANMESDKDSKWRKALMTHAESGRKLAVLSRQAAERREAEEKSSTRKERER
jgi:ssDNA-binding Zn-finger/Zn-ribbon topoisomerase 1